MILFGGKEKYMFLPGLKIVVKTLFFTFLHQSVPYHKVHFLKFETQANVLKKISTFLMKFTTSHFTWLAPK